MVKNCFTCFIATICLQEKHPRTVLSYHLNTLLLRTGNDMVSIHISWSVHVVLITNTTLFTRKSLFDYNKDLGLVLLSLLALNKCDKGEYFQRRRGSKIESVSTKGLTGSSHIKALLEAVCFYCVVCVCLLACSPSELFFFLLLVLTVWQRQRWLLLQVIVVLGWLVDHLNKDVEDREKGNGFWVWAQKITPLIENHLKWILPDHPLSQWSWWEPSWLLWFQCEV